jgi:DNA-binding NarL/FixJ family response regulator
MEALSLLGSRATPATPALAGVSAGLAAQDPARGGPPAPASAAASLVEPITEPITQIQALQPHQQHLLENLSPRQQDIMRLVHRGWTNKMIARELGVAEGTVKVHLSVIFRALGVHNRSTAIAVINGWLEAGRTL